jgi:hypothetical protein
MRRKPAPICGLRQAPSSRSFREPKYNRRNEGRHHPNMWRNSPPPASPNPAERSLILRPSWCNLTGLSIVSPQPETMRFETYLEWQANPSLHAVRDVRLLGAPACGSAGCGLDRSPRPSRSPLPQREAPPLWKTPRAATGTESGQTRRRSHFERNLAEFRSERSPLPATR